RKRAPAQHPDRDVPAERHRPALQLPPGRVLRGQRPDRARGALGALHRRGRPAAPRRAADLPRARPRRPRAAPPSRTDDVGLGPWPGRPDAWPDDPRLDPELLAHGDRRNVVDRYRYWRLEAIVADLDTRRHPLHVAIENLGH